MQIKREVLKYLAIMFMLEDHIVQTFMEKGSMLYAGLDAISRFTFVTMSFLLVEGFFYTRSKPKYLKRMLIFALISQLPYHLAFGPVNEPFSQFVGLNIFFTLSFCFLMIWGLEKYTKKWQQILIVTATCFICCICDWMFMAPLITNWFYNARGDKKKQIKAYIYTAILVGIMGSSTAIFGKQDLLLTLYMFLVNISGVILSGVLTLHFYDGQQYDKHKAFNKWLFYVFYPAHLSIIWIIRYCVFKNIF